MCNAHKAAMACYIERKKERLKAKRKTSRKGGRFAGYETYREYLLSDLWQSIRERVLDLHDRKCGLCKGAATQVHHRHYGIRTLTGKTLVHLFPVCGPCHLLIEFDACGLKRSAPKAEQWLCAILLK